MYTAHIGRRLLDLYNQHRRVGSPLSAREFFDEVFFPLFFDHERYLMFANNSKFDQKAKQRKSREPSERQDALASFHAEVATLDKPLGHLFLGGTASEATRATSGQITDISVPLSTDDVYMSWFGTAASIGVRGGLSLLVDDDEVLLALLDGWEQYRAYMAQTPHLKPYQIDSWNGWWLIHRFDEMFDPGDPLRDLPELPEEKNGKAEFRTPPWVRVLFALAGRSQSKPQIAYVYSFGQSNTTVGFVRIDLPAIRGLPDLYERLFGKTPAFVGRRQFIGMYETAFGIRRACELGSIGLRAIEPNKLRDFMPLRGSKNALPSTPSGKKREEQEVSFAIYKTWIIAMLNNEELLKIADEAATALRNLASPGKRAKTTNARSVEEALKATHRRAFIEGLTAILERDETYADVFVRLVRETVLMPVSDFPLLLTLIRFMYAVPHQESQD